MPTQVLSNLDLNNVARITNSVNGTAAQDLVTVSQLNSAVEGLAWKDSVRSATQGNISLAAPGLTVDGVTMVVNDRFLARAQTAGAENGIYIWNGSATPATRSLDSNTADELEQAITTVEEGTSAGASFRQSVVNATLGTTTLTWTTFGTGVSAATEATAGIAAIATQVQTDTGTNDTNFITALKLSVWSGRARKFSQTFGDGTATQYTITHNFATDDVHVEVYRTTGAKDTIICDVDRPTANAVRVTFASPVALNAFRCVVQM